MDALVYQYEGNQLTKVDDTSGILSGFNDGNTAGDDYDYDDNGNLKLDRNKDITSITYNYLNLPTEITFTGSNAGTISYIYDAAGTKLEKVVNPTAQNATTTQYCMGYIYENDNLQFFGQAEGYIGVENGNYNYVYQFKDHLGNVRLSYTDANGNGIIETGVNDTEIIEENNYYPFGLKHKGYNNSTSSLGNSKAQGWKYNDTELEEGLELNMYEMDWRQHDPTIGRFVSIDKLAEDVYDFTPYRFGLNNPIIYSDPTGLYEETDSTYSTTRRDEIERLLNFIRNSEKKVNIDDVNEFIEADIEFTKLEDSTYKLSGITVINREATAFSIHKTANEIAYYEGDTDYLYTREDYELRNEVIKVSSGPNDAILRTILGWESRGQFQPITASNYIDYVGGEFNARLLTFNTYSTLQLALPGGSGGKAKPKASKRFRPSGASAAGANRTGMKSYIGMSFKEFHMKNSHLFKGKYKGRGTYMTHMSMTWRILTF